jgi:hypothetical protein
MKAICSIASLLMSQRVRSDKGKNTRIITQISEKEYLVEGNSDWIRLGCQFDPSVITSINMDGGPFLLVGDSFLGKGQISGLYHIQNDIDNYYIIKVTLY